MRLIDRATGLPPVLRSGDRITEWTTTVHFDEHGICAYPGGLTDTGEEVQYVTVIRGDDRA